MLGLALMVRDLAEKRNDGTKLNFGGPDRTPVSREQAQQSCYSTSAEYYAIIDRIARGEKP